MLKVLKALILIVNVGVIIALLTIHFIIKDSGFRQSLLFYTLPLPIIIAIVLFLSLFVGKRIRKYNLILAGVLMLVWLVRSFRLHFFADVTSPNLEIVFWNASRDQGFEEAFNENGNLPDVMVLVESKVNDLNALTAKYPNFFFYRIKKEVYISSKTPIKILKKETSKHKSAVIKFNTKGIDFFVVDAQGSFGVPRRVEMAFIDSQIDVSKKTIVLGDFNLPYESVLFKKIKKNFNHAFTKKGLGFRETWFYGWPLLSIDHIWVSKDVEILKAEKLNTQESDHSMIKTYLKIE
ncbi:endonuclease/exonuclease/phosphatase family protein [Flavobacteriaceae bacterium XHP0103]|uniref:endonuclease/exonuclease/phosphatase family protein n=1 Tax=Marixanthotalea marina TaxID=2844359 RepID=UPI00298A064F|nr:endonuclease/exonuclease/phosphatase family protein [Marixanthotalea marina]MBU3820496.1 endonuclease/exonuclease/phosphatase family protein [Marixanthotalea marina]